MNSLNAVPSVACAVVMALLFSTGTGCNIRYQGSQGVNGTSRGITITGSGEDQRIQMSIADAKSQVEFDSTGIVQFADDDRSVVTISPNGQLRMKEKAADVTREIVMTPDDAQQAIKEVYRVNGKVADVDEPGRQWVQAMLQRVITESPIGAKPRAERILKKSGPEGLILELERLQHGSANETYIDVLLTNDLPADVLVRAVEVSAKTVSSSSSLADILVSMAPREPDDESLSLAIIETVSAISSSSSQEECLKAVAEHRQLTPAVAIAAIQAATKISSSSSKTSALRAIVGAAGVDSSMLIAYVEAVETISSSSDQGEALESLLQKDLQDSAVFTRIIKAVGKISSTSTQQEVLEDIISSAPNEPNVLNACLDVIGRISSSFTQEELLEQFLRRPDLDRATLARAGETIKQISSSSSRDKLQQQLIERLSH